MLIFGPFQGTYDDETLWNYEAGVKYPTRRHHLQRGRLYTDIKNLQVNVDAGSCSSRVVFNAEKAHTMGLEAELSARPMPGLDLSFAGSLVESKFDHDRNPGGGDDLVLVTGIRDGNRLPAVPKFRWRRRRPTAPGSTTMPTGTSTPAFSISATATRSRGPGVESAHIRRTDCRSTAWTAAK